MFRELMDRYPVLYSCKDSIQKAFDLMMETYEKQGKVIICGNGGSCADAEHMVGELMKSFLKKRPIYPETVQNILKRFPYEKNLLKLQQPLPAIVLNDHCALTTAILNDMDPDLLYAQQLLGYAVPGKDLFFGISTSGNAMNVSNAFKLSQALNMPSILLTGQDGGVCRKFAQVAICVPEKETYKIQELHLPIYHALCAACEDAFWGGVE